MPMGTVWKPRNDSLMVEQVPGVRRQVIACGERAMVVRIAIDKDAVVPIHTHPNEQIGYISSGKFRFTIGDETRDVRTGGTWRILADVPHSVIVGPQGALIVEVFSPVRDAWSAIESQEPRPGRWP